MFYDIKKSDKPYIFITSRYLCNFYILNFSKFQRLKGNKKHRQFNQFSKLLICKHEADIDTCRLYVCPSVLYLLNTIKQVYHYKDTAIPRSHYNFLIQFRFHMKLSSVVQVNMSNDIPWTSMEGLS